MGARVGGRLSVHLEAFFFFFCQRHVRVRKLGGGGEPCHVGMTDEQSREVSMFSKTQGLQEECFRCFAHAAKT